MEGRPATRVHGMRRCALSADCRRQRSKVMALHTATGSCHGKHDTSASPPQGSDMPELALAPRLDSPGPAGGSRRRWRRPCRGAARQQPGGRAGRRGGRRGPLRPGDPANPAGTCAWHHVEWVPIEKPMHRLGYLVSETLSCSCTACCCACKTAQAGLFGQRYCS